MDKIYILPKLNNRTIFAPNPYMENLEEAISKNFEIINKNYFRFGVLELYKFFFKTDTYVLNWIEDLPIYKLGKIQVFFFIIFLFLKKLFSKNIIWVLHNKYSHFTSKNTWTDIMYNLLMKHSDLILTHSSEGVIFAREYYSLPENKVHFIDHPTKPSFPEAQNRAYKYDMIVWGSIHPYKGILEFVKFVKSNTELNNLKILIVGKSYNEEYLNKLKSELTSSIHLKNQILSLHEISVLAQNSKFIFFPYNSPSLLSSGVLMDSLRMRTKILGPNSGSFKDLSYLSIIDVYENFSDLPKFFKKDSYSHFDQNEIEKFLKENSWENFSIKFLNFYSNLKIK